MTKRLVRVALLSLLLGLGLAVGTVFAFSSAPDEPVIASGVWCAEYPGWCTTNVLVWSDVADPDYYSVVGRETGCGNEARIQDGSMWIENATAHLQWVVNVENTWAPDLCQYNAAIDLGTNSGLVEMACHYEGYHTLTNTINLVPCSVELLDRPGIDPSQR